MRPQQPGAASSAPQPAAAAPDQWSRRATLGGLAAAGLVLPTTTALPAAAEPFCGVVDRPPVWSYAVPWEEAPFEYGGLTLWTRVVGEAPSDGFLGIGKKGDKSKLPVLCVAGGPGLGSAYLESLEFLCVADRRVCFYDMGGCGKSLGASKGAVPEQMTLEYYIDELAALASHTFERYHVFGDGFGGMLAASAAAAGRLPGAVSLTLSGLPDSYRSLVADRRAKVEALPKDAQAELLRADGLPGSGAGAAAELYRAQFLCHRNAGCLRSALSGAAAVGPVQAALTGGKAFEAAGALAGWELPRTGLEGMPVLLTYGEDGELSARTAARAADALPRAETVRFERAGSLVHIDECWELFLERMNDFCTKVEAPAAA